MMLFKHLYTFALVMLSSSLMVGCGEADFSGMSENKAQVGKKPPQTGNVLPNALSLVWNLPCQENVASSMQQSDNRIDLYGPGPHLLDANTVNGAPVILKGDSCGASDITRDVVFVIDVSGSMHSRNNRGQTNGGTDPMRNGTCGRMQALSNVIKTIKQRSPGRFAVVTFASDVKQASSQLFSDEQQLYADLLSSGGFNTIEDLICDGNGQTNYDAGLMRAQALLAAEATGGDRTMKEVYFISDGQPEPANKNGKAVSESMRAEEITIATVMVGGEDDSVMKNFVASKDQLNAPLHARAEYSSQLTEVLGKLAGNTVVSAQLNILSGSTAIQSLDFSDKLIGSNFDFQGFFINTSDAPTGIKVELKYKDRFGDERTHVGELQWNAN